MTGKSGIIVDMRKIANWGINRKEWKGIDLLEALAYLDKHGYKFVNRTETRITHRGVLNFAKPGTLSTYEVTIISGEKPWPTVKKEEN